MRSGLLLAGVLLGLLAATAGVSWWAWDQMAGTDIGVHGYVALGLGVVATLVIGGGLMGLVFYSSRHGYDERAGRDQRGE